MSYGTFSYGTRSYATADTAAAPAAQQVAPAGKASSAAFGSPTRSATRAVPVAGRASAAAVGSPAAGATRAVPVAGRASAAALGSPAVGRGAVSRAVAGISDPAAFGSPTVGRGAVAVAPAGKASTAAIGTPLVGTGALVLVPASLASTAALGSPAVGRGAVSRAVAGIAPTAALGAPRATIRVLPQGKAPSSALGTPSLKSVRTLLLQGLPGTSQTGTPVVGAGGSLVAPAGRASTAALGTPTALRGVRPVLVTGFTTTALGTPAVGNIKVVAPQGVAGSSTCGAPLVARGPVSRAVAGIPSLTGLGVPVASAGASLVAPAGVAGASALGQPAVAAAAAQVRPAAIAGNSQTGEPAASPGPVWIAVASLAHPSSFGLPWVRDANSYAVDGIPPRAALGVVQVSRGVAAARRDLFSAGIDVAFDCFALDLEYRGPFDVSWVPVRAVRATREGTQDVGQGLVVSQARRFKVRAADCTPERGGLLRYGGEEWEVVGDPTQDDPRRFTWTLVVERLYPDAEFPSLADSFSAGIDVAFGSFGVGASYVSPWGEQLPGLLVVPAARDAADDMASFGSQVTTASRVKVRGSECRPEPDGVFEVEGMGRLRVVGDPYREDPRNHVWTCTVEPAP